MRSTGNDLTYSLDGQLTAASPQPLVVYPEPLHLGGEPYDPCSSLRDGSWTVMPAVTRRETTREPGNDAGQSEVLPIDKPLWRFYRRYG
jgi:hypothetical protein